MVLQIFFRILFLVFTYGTLTTQNNCRVDEPIKNFGLTEVQFNDLAGQLQKGNNELFKSIFLAHFKDCMDYLQKKFKASHGDAYDASMHTLINFRTRIVDGKIRYGNLRFLFTRMAAQVYQKSKKMQPTTLEDQHDFMEQDDFDWDPEDLKNLRNAWNKLDPGCLELLQLNYYQNYKLSEIAEMKNINPATIRKQKERCKEKLIQLFKQNNNYNE